MEDTIVETESTKVKVRPEDRYINEKINGFIITGYSHCKKNNKNWPIHYYIGQCESCGNISTKRIDIFKRNGCMVCKAKRQSRFENGKYCTSLFLTRIISGANHRNKARKGNKIEFNLTVEDIDNLYEKQNGKCALSGIDIYPILYPRNKAGLAKNGQYKEIKDKINGSLDRIDSNKGYTIDNVQIVHIDINSMKQSLTDTEFIKLCTLVAEHNKSK